MTIMIRHETVKDYNSIANVNYEAFLNWHPDNNYVSEPLLVDLLRHNALFDPELSLVAETEGKVVGHALFSPYDFRLMGRPARGVVLGPVAVIPQYQSQGIGRMLIEEGHKRAEEKGFEFSLLCGHPEYYPRFGYKVKVFSLSGARLTINDPGFNPVDFQTKPVNRQDLPKIKELWHKMHDNDPLALFPGGHVSAWTNYSPGGRSITVLHKDRMIGYTRYENGENPYRLKVKEVLAEDNDLAQVLSYLLWSGTGKRAGELEVPLSPEYLSNALTGKAVKIAEMREVNDAFMVKVLGGNNPPLSYLDQLKEGKLQPGIIVFPSVFEVDDGRTD